MDSNIKEAEATISVLESIENSSELFSSLINYFDEQAECYSHLGFMICINLMNKKGDDLFNYSESMLDSSINRVLKSFKDYNNGVEENI